MTTYTVEVTLRPVVDDNWTKLREMTDVVPGTILLEDPEEPVLIFPVDADEPRGAAIFIEGVASIAGIEIVSGEVYPTPPEDFDRNEDVSSHSSASTLQGFQPNWLPCSA